MENMIMEKIWNDLFGIRHYLNDFLREGAGHIGYGIKKIVAEKDMPPRAWN